MNFVTMGLIKFAKSIWPVLIYMVVGLFILRRKEKDEQKRMEETIKRDKLKRVCNQKHISSRY